MDTGLFPLITTEFVAKDDSIIRFELFNRDVADVEDRNAPTSPGMGEYYDWFHADWRVPAEEPIVIEWSGDKKETIIGSTCTVQLVSPYDGALQTLYTTDPRLWCCLVSRKAVGADSFSDVWFGWLDPEFYEEPFIAKKDYEVTLTFSDFGVLKRIIYDPLDDTETLISILLQTRLQIFPVGDSYEDRVITSISTTLQDNGAITSGISVRTANFTDEDGETMTWYDALEAVLKPLALRIEQRAGNLWVYDINALVGVQTIADSYIIYFWDDGEPESYVSSFSTYESALQYAENLQELGHNTRIEPLETHTEANAASVEAEWTSDDQRLSVDETFNNVKITFSPYAETTLLDGEKVEFTATETFAPVKNGYGHDASNEYESFLLHLADNTAQVDGITLGSGICPFKIEALQGGNDCRGVVAFLGDIYYNHSTYRRQLNERDMYDSGYNTDQLDYTYLGRVPTMPTVASGYGAPAALYTTRRIWIPNAYGNSKLTGKNQVLKIQIPMLYSEKYNPWEQSDDDHNKEYTQHFRECCNSIMLQLRIRIYAAKTGGNALFYYQNWAWGYGDTNTDPTPDYRGKLETNQFRMNVPEAGWKAASNTQVLPTLIHYCKFDGSKVDEHNISIGDGMADGGEPFYNRNETSYTFRKNFDGIYIPLPNIAPTDSNYRKGYWLEVEVTDGLYLYDKEIMYKSGESTPFAKFCSGPISSVDNDDPRTYKDSRWWLVGFPTIKLVQNNRQIYEDIDVEDIEQSGVVDANAAEELSIDTICGSIDVPFAKGAYFHATTGQPISSLHRGSRTTSVEQLLIGTLYSQYAGRHLKLSGTAKAVLPTGGLCLLTESHYPDKRFLVTSEVYNIIDGESEITMTEASPDNYTSS